MTMQAGTLITPRLAEEAINSRLTCLPIESLPLDAVRRRHFAGKHLCGARPAALRSRHHGRHRGRQRGVAPGRAALSHSGDAGRPASPALKLAADEAHRSDDGRRFCRWAATASFRSSSSSSPTASPRSTPAVVATPYHNVHRRGNDSRQGTLLLEAGTLAARAGNRGRRLGRHGPRAREQSAGPHDRIDRR